MFWAQGCDVVSGQVSDSVGSDVRTHHKCRSVPPEPESRIAESEPEPELENQSYLSRILYLLPLHHLFVYFLSF